MYFLLVVVVFFTGEMILYCSNMSRKRLILSSKWIGTLIACCCLKIASNFRGSDEFTFPSPKLDVA